MENDLTLAGFNWFKDMRLKAGSFILQDNNDLSKRARKKTSSQLFKQNTDTIIGSLIAVER